MYKILFMRMNHLLFAVALASFAFPITACADLPETPPSTSGPQPVTVKGASRMIKGRMAGPGADFSNVDLTRENLSNLDLTGANFSGAKFFRAFLSRSILTGANLSGADISTSNVYRTNFTDADLTNASLNNVNAEEAIFTGARLSGATFLFSYLFGAKFDAGALDGADTNGATMPDGTISEKVKN
ncbi:MAG: pentapeptide repeat-containing protein [Actinobacteria bacterium]|nr:pentapeptide repeat-containing protein [Actinomycetota bacterium]